MQVGRGATVGVDLLMEHSKPYHPEQIQSVGLSTGWGAEGRWEMIDTEGGIYIPTSDEIFNLATLRLLLFRTILSDFQL